MAKIDMVGIGHSYSPNPQSEADYALKTFDMSWEDGGAYSLLGPSGCGKSTLLNIISGLLTPSHGKLLFDGKDVSDLPPEKRNIAQVFQFPVIYDTMTVFDNLAFPLRNRKISEGNVRKRVEEVAESLDLTSVLKNRAKGLTADFKQMISLGRGLVRNDVSAVLFDEPLTVIDPHLKWQVRRRLKQIQEQFNMTMILVTHDQTEALTFADKVVLMYDGQVIQQGTPEELFNQPEHTFVGYFIGSPGMNLLRCQIENNMAKVANHSIPLPSQIAQKAAKSQGELKIGIRPEFCQVVESGTPGSFPLEVTRVVGLSDHFLVNAQLEGQAVCAKVTTDDAPKLGTQWFRFPEERIHLYANERVIQ